MASVSKKTGGRHRRKRSNRSGVSGLWVTGWVLACVLIGYQSGLVLIAPPSRDSVEQARTAADIKSEDQAGDFQEKPVADTAAREDAATADTQRQKEDPGDEAVSPEATDVATVAPGEDPALKTTNRTAGDRHEQMLRILSRTEANLAGPQP
ncbi:MAG: hypothetical protein ACFE0O_04390 [Opitutales bacterium]